MSEINLDHRTAIVTRASTAEVVGEQPKATMLLADFDATGGKLSTNRTWLGPGDGGPPPHYHATSAELFFILGGALEVLTGDRVTTLTEGDLLVVPPYMPHAWKAPADQPADVLIVFTPGIERFEYFRMVGRLFKGEATEEELFAAEERYDNHWVDNETWRLFLEDPAAYAAAQAAHDGHDGCEACDS